MATSDKEKKLRAILNLVNDGLTKADFVTSFKSVVKIIKQLEANHTKSTVELEKKIAIKVKELAKKNDINFSEVRDIISQTQKLSLKKQETSLNFIRDKVRKIKEGVDGLDGKDGIGGKDGSPDFAEDVRNKLELLQEDERLDISAIRGISKLKKGFDRSMEGLKKSKIGSMGIGLVVNTIKRGRVNFLDFVGSANIDVTYSKDDGLDTVNFDTSNDYTLAQFDDFMQFFNGSFLENFDALVTSSGTVVTMSLEKSGGSGGDLTMRFSDGFTALDCTPACTIELSTNTDEAPQANFIYIPQSTKVLTKSTSGFPTDAEHIKIAYFLVPTATFVASDGVYINQNWNDGAMDMNSQGHMSHMAERSRRDGAYYFNGIDPDGTSDYLVLDGVNVDFQSTEGDIFQMHRHTYPAKDTLNGDDVHVVNWSGDAYHVVTNLYDIVKDSTGTTIGNNQYFNLVFWGVGNKGGTHEPLMCNVSAGTYSTESDATNDVSGYDNFSIPREFSIDSSTGFLICRITVRKLSSAWTYVSTTDLRGVTPQAASGSATAGDMQKSVYDPTNVQADAFDITNIVGGIEGDGVLKLTVGTTEPTSPTTGDLWYDTT